MKLVEALSLRASLVQKVSNLREQLNNNLFTPEDEAPLYQPADTLRQLNATLDELQTLIYRINITNTRTMVDGKTLTALIAERDVLKARVKTLDEVMRTIRNRRGRYGSTELKMVCSVDPEEYQRMYEKAASDLRRLDLRIQSAGWETELIAAE